MVEKKTAKRLDICYNNYSNRSGIITASKILKLREIID